MEITRTYEIDMYASDAGANKNLAIITKAPHHMKRENVHVNTTVGPKINKRFRETVHQLLSGNDQLHRLHRPRNNNTQILNVLCYASANPIECYVRTTHDHEAAPDAGYAFANPPTHETTMYYAPHAILNTGNPKSTYQYMPTPYKALHNR